MMYLNKLLIQLLILLAASGCAVNQDNILKINANERTIRDLSSGSVIGYTQRNNSIWLGIPYAQAPINELRWKAPREVIAWEGLLETTKYNQPCTQIGSTFGDPSAEVGSVHGSEDCLYLNIFAPKEIPENEKLPVMFWIHGGSNTIGTSSLYDPSVLAASQKVIVVTLNYRLGLFGWFLHPSFITGATNFEDQSGNYGTLDQIAALKWVQGNISQFGGDSSNVTIFGESAGGHNTYALMFSSLADGLFHKAIAQSGSTKTSSLSESINYFDNNLQPGNKNSSKELFNQLLIADGMAEDRQSAIIIQDALSNKEQYDFLIDRTTEEIIQTYYNNLDNKDYMHQVINDGYVIPENGMDFQNTQKLKDIPVIMGTNRDEMKLFLAFDPEFASQRFSLTFIKDQDFYDISSEYGSMGWKVAAVDKPATELVSLGNKNIFGYRFDWDEEPKVLLMDLSRILGAAHAIEIPFVMGGMKLGGLEDYMFDKKNIKTATQLSKSMMSYWSEFAYNGDPGKGRNAEQIKWHAWDNNNQQEKFIILDTKADGGIRMSLEAMSYASLVEGLLLDPRIPNDQMRCEFLYKAIDANWVIDERIINSGLCNVN